MRPVAVAAVAFLASLAMPMLAAAAQDGQEWPMFRADAQHTGACGSPLPQALPEPLVVGLGTSPLTSPVAAGGRIFVCSADGTLHSVWADNGAPAWSRPLGANCSAEPAVDGATVYALTETGVLLAFDTERGTPLWNFSLQADRGYTLPLTFSNGSLLVSTTSGWVSRVPASGQGGLMWQSFIGGSLKGPVTVGGRGAYAVLDGGKAVAVDLVSGIPTWSTPPGTGSSNEFPSAYLQGRLYICTRGRDVFCLDTSLGSEVWNRSLPSTVAGAPALGGGMMVIGTQNGFVFALNLTTGMEIWEEPFRAAGDAAASPALAAGMVVLCDDKGRVSLMEAATGTGIANLQLPGRRFSSPVVSGGRILVTSAEGALFIMGPRPTRPSATLEMSPARASTGEEVVFSARNFSSPARLAPGGLYVDFGDGTAGRWSSGMEQRHSFSQKGTYAVSWKVMDQNGTESHAGTGAVEVFNDRPSVVLELPTEARAGEPVELGARASDPDGRLLLYEWDFDGDGSFDWSAGQMPPGFNHTFPVNGLYNISVRVRDDNGSLAVSSGTLRVLPALSRPPVAPPPPLSLPAAAASVSLVSLAAAGAGLSLTDFGKYRFFTLFIVPLYVRLKRDEVLDNYTRGRIMGYITANPGDNYNSIRDALELTNGIAAHHLHTLEREGCIQSMRDGMYRRFWPQNARLPPEDEGHFNIQKRIVAVIRESPGISQKEIAQKVGVSSPTVNYHIRVLETARMIYVKKFGRRTGCYVVDDRPQN